MVNMILLKVYNDKIEGQLCNPNIAKYSSRPSTNSLILRQNTLPYFFSTLQTFIQVNGLINRKR